MVQVRAREERICVWKFAITPFAPFRSFIRRFVRTVLHILNLLLFASVHSECAIRASRFFIMHWMALFAAGGGDGGGVYTYILHFVMTCCRQYSTWKSTLHDHYSQHLFHYIYTNELAIPNTQKVDSKTTTAAAAAAAHFLSICLFIAKKCPVSALNLIYPNKMWSETQLTEIKSLLMQLNNKPWATCIQMVTLTIFSESFCTKQSRFAFFTTIYFSLCFHSFHLFVVQSLAFVVFVTSWWKLRKISTAFLHCKWRSFFLSR